MIAYDTITFLSDFGTVDEFVGVCKSVIRTIAPSVAVVDLTHEIPPFDVRAGSLTLVRAAEYLSPGVVLAIVDPGVATDRRAIAVELGNGESVLVGPDNGLLAPITALSGGASRAVELSEPTFWLQSQKTTFAGRDVFAPAAAHLCNGTPLTDLGSEIDSAGLVPGFIPFSGNKDGYLCADVIWIDRYGNVQLNVSPQQLVDFGDIIVVTHGNETIAAARVRAFAEVGSDRLGVMDDANGLVSLIVNGSSAAARHRLNVGDAVTLHTATDSLH